jgi:hypothetical protein
MQEIKDAYIFIGKNLREREHLVNLNQDVMGLWISFRGDDV